VNTGRYYDMVPKDFDANLRFRKEMLAMAGSDPLAAAQIQTMCAQDLLFYVNGFCWTYSPKDRVGSNPVTPFITYTDFQDGAMLEIQECIMYGEDFGMPKSRDMGASWMGLVVFEHEWHYRADLSFLLISRNEDYVDKSGNPKALFWKIDFLHKHQPRWMLPTGRWLGSKDPNRRLLHLGNADNGSVIDGESTTGDAGRGDRRTAMFIDEHGAFDINDGFRVLRATRDTTNCRGFNSTPQGANNAFYKVIHETSARIIRLHWSQHPLKNKGLYTSNKDTGKVTLLDEFRGMVKVSKKGEKGQKGYMYPDDYPFNADGKTRSPWYDNECARCVSPMEIAQELDIDFLGSDHQFFDHETIQILKKLYCRPPLTVGVLEYDDESCTPKRYTETAKGELSLWLTLTGDGVPARDRKFIVGADVSAGTGASNSVASVVDKATGEKIAVWTSPNWRPNPFAKQVIALAKFFNNALLVWDASGATGETFTKRVIAAPYGNVYYRRREKKIGQNLTDEPGYYLNPNAKQTLFEDYRDALGSHKFINRSERGMEECMQFIRRNGGIEHSEAANTQDPSGARTAHGDEVVADALACFCLTDTYQASMPEEQEIPEGCLAWRRKQRENQNNEKNQDRLGVGW